FFFIPLSPTDFYTLSLHDALPISSFRSLMRSGRHKTRSAEEARLRSVCPFSLRELRAGPAERAWTIGRAEKLLFNIGRIPVRQSRLPPFCVPGTANLAAGQKRGSAAAAS